MSKAKVRVGWLTNIRRAVPEYAVAAAVGAGLLAAALIHTLFSLSEENRFVLAVNIAGGLAAAAASFLLKRVNVLSYAAMISAAAVEAATGSSYYNQAFYSLALVASAAAIPKVYPAEFEVKRIRRLVVAVRSEARTLRIPKGAEAYINLVLSAPLIASAAASAALYALGYQLALIPLAYSSAASLLYFFNFRSAPVELEEGVKPTKLSVALLLSVKYPWVYMRIRSQKDALAPLFAAAGFRGYEYLYVARWTLALFWAINAAPPAALAVFAATYSPLFAALPFASVLVVHYGPRIHLSLMARSRASACASEYPFFVAYLYTVSTAGVRLYDAFKDLATKGSEILKAFSREGSLVVRAVEQQGLLDSVALARYAASHPNDDVRNLINGYLNVTAIGGSVVSYFDMKLKEALDALRTKYESAARTLEILMSVMVMAMILPSVVIVLGLTLSPEVVVPMAVLSIAGIYPMLAFMLYSFSSVFRLDMGNVYKIRFAASAVLGAASVLPAYLLFYDKSIVAAIAFIAGMIALGVYIEYARQRAAYSTIESQLPQLLKDLADLRRTTTLSKALEVIKDYKYPPVVRQILARLYARRSAGERISEQPWHSKAWFWKFFQFLLGKIDDTGGGSAELFRKLADFIIDYNNINRSTVSRLRIYEFLIYFAPALLTIILGVSLGLFTGLPKAFGASGLDQSILSQVEQLGGAQARFLKMVFQGIDPGVLTLAQAMPLALSLAMGLVGGKITGGTVKNTRILAVALLVTAVMVGYGADYMASMLMPATARPGP